MFIQTQTKTVTKHIPISSQPNFIEVDCYSYVEINEAKNKGTGKREYAMKKYATKHINMSLVVSIQEVKRFDSSSQCVTRHGDGWLTDSKTIRKEFNPIDLIKIVFVSGAGGDLLVKFKKTSKKGK